MPGHTASRRAFRVQRNLLLQSKLTIATKSNRKPVYDIRHGSRLPGCDYCSTLFVPLQVSAFGLK
jgi:hypothetical protein